MDVYLAYKSFNLFRLSIQKSSLNSFKPAFTIVNFIHYKPRIAVAILDLQWMKVTWSGW